MTTTSINQAEIITSGAHTLQASEVQAQAKNGTPNRGKPESELRAAARRHGLTLKELADRMGVNKGHLCTVANGHRPWTPYLRDKGPGRPGRGPRAGHRLPARAAWSPVKAVSSGSGPGRRGMTLKDLAVAVGVSYRFMTQAARGQRNMSPSLQKRVESALGGPAEIAAARCANRQYGPVKGETTWIRERAREMGLSMGELADLVGVTRGFMSDVARGLRNMGPAVQARVEAVLEGPVKIEPAQRPTVDPRALWDRMDAHGLSQNETARRAGISNALLSQIMNGQRTPSGKVLRKLHEVLFRPSAAELVVAAEVKVMAWKKDERQGVVVKGAGGPGAGGNNPGGGTVRIGGRVPWGAEVQYAYRAGYDSRGQVSVTHLVDERGYGVMLNRPEPQGA